MSCAVRSTLGCSRGPSERGGRRGAANSMGRIAALLPRLPLDPSIDARRRPKMRALQQVLANPIRGEWCLLLEVRLLPL